MNQYLRLVGLAAAGLVLMAASVFVVPHTHHPEKDAKAHAPGKMQ
jgi:hypothetical protein